MSQSDSAETKTIFTVISESRALASTLCDLFSLLNSVCLTLLDLQTLALPAAAGPAMAWQQVQEKRSAQTAQQRQQWSVLDIY
jgi:hypothetical protein